MARPKPKQRGVICVYTHTSCARIYVFRWLSGVISVRWCWTGYCLINATYMIDVCNFASKSWILDMDHGCIACCVNVQNVENETEVQIWHDGNQTSGNRDRRELVDHMQWVWSRHCCIGILTPLTPTELFVPRWEVVITVLHPFESDRRYELGHWCMQIFVVFAYWQAFYNSVRLMVGSGDREHKLFFENQDGWFYKIIFWNFDFWKKGQKILRPPTSN